MSFIQAMCIFILWIIMFFIVSFASEEVNSYILGKILYVLKIFMICVPTVAFVILMIVGALGYLG